MIWPLPTSAFGYIKGRLQGTEFSEKDNVLAEIREILDGISGKVLKAVSIERERRLQTCIDAGGEHVE
jgi:hypothetical protein